MNIHMNERNLTEESGEGMFCGEWIENEENS